MLQQHLQTPQVSQGSSSTQRGYWDAPATSSINRLSVAPLRQKVTQQEDVISAHSTVQGLAPLAVLILIFGLQQREDLRDVHQTHVDSLAQDHPLALGWHKSKFRLLNCQIQRRQSAQTWSTGTLWLSFSFGNSYCVIEAIKIKVI